MIHASVDNPGRYDDIVSLSAGEAASQGPLFAGQQRSNNAVPGGCDAGPVVWYAGNGGNASCLFHG